MSVLVYILFFAILWAIIYGDAQRRFMALFAGTLLFPNVCLFIKNPSISPQHIFLYTFILVEMLKTPDDLNKEIWYNPLRIPLFLTVFSYISTSIFNGGLLSIDMYYGVRDIIDTFGYLIAAYIIGKKISIDDFAKKIMPFIIICCIFGILESLLNANYPYKIINSAFPKYEGLYDLNGSVSLSQNWRLRSCFTTKHPTAFGTFLMTMFLFYLPYIRRQTISHPKLWLTLALLGLNVFLCGSRTSLVCTIFGTILFIIDKFNVYLKIFTWGTLLFCSSIIMAFMISRFGASTGSGSSLDFRAKQLIFSIMTIEQSPIFGNGNKYASHNLFEEDDAGNKRAQDSSGDDMGGLESVVFTLLIDRGFVGLTTYYLLLAWLFVIFYASRNKYAPKNDTFIIVISGTFFLTLSGSIGNSSAFLFMIMGLQLGQLSQKKEELPTSLNLHQ